MRRWPVLATILAVVALLGTACSNDEPPSASATSNTQTTGTETSGTATSGTATSGTATSGTETSGGGEGGQITINGDTANDHGSADVSGKDELELETDDFYFNPTTLNGTAGQTLKLEIKNEGGSEHNFTLEDQSIDQDVEPGEDATVTVTFPDSGILEFWCKYHRSSGMVGQLSVG